MPPPIAGSDVFIGTDILRIMRSIAATHEAVRLISGEGGGEYASGYSVGFIDGLKAMAEAMGLRFQPGVSNVSIGRRYGDGDGW